MTLDLAKPMQTRDGQPVEILTTKGRYPEFPIVGYIDSSEYIEVWMLDGSNRNVRGRADLVNVPEPKLNGVFWVNVCDKESNRAPRICLFPYATKKEADSSAASWGPSYKSRIACAHVEWAEGDGLEIIND